MDNKTRDILQKFSKQKIELSLVADIEKEYNKIKKDADALYSIIRTAAQNVDEVSSKASELLKRVNNTDTDVNKLKQAANNLGIGLPSEAEISVRQLDTYKNRLKQLESKAAKASDVLFAMMG